MDYDTENDAMYFMAREKAGEATQNSKGETVDIDVAIEKIDEDGDEIEKEKQKALPMRLYRYNDFPSDPERVTSMRITPSTPINAITANTSFLWKAPDRAG
jgi:uncharacterized protein YuzE